MPFQALQGGNHFGRAHQFGCACVGAVFALAAEPHHDKAGQEAEQDLQHEVHQHIDAVVTRFAVVAPLRHHAGDDAGEEDNKRVYHALNQRERYHVTVADVCHFVRQHGFHFVARHAVEQACGHSNQRAVAGCACGEGVGFGRLVDGDFGRFQVPLLGLVLHGLQQPCFHFAARRGDDLRAHGVLRHGFGQQQGNDGAGEADYGGVGEHLSHAAAAGVDAQHA